MSRRVKKGLAIATGALALLVFLTVGAAYVLSFLELRGRHEVNVSPPRFMEEWQDTARGARLARVLGCRDCHGDDLGGKVMSDTRTFGRLVAPNLTRVRDSYSDADMVRALHHGVRPDGTGLLPMMPVQMFTNLSKRDLAAIIAYVRSRPRVANTLPPTRLALAARALIAVGTLPMAPELVDHDEPLPASVASDDPEVFGSYLAHVACPECHGPDLQGREAFLVTPPLEIAAAYSLDEFRHLLRTGEGLGGRDLGLMSGVARGRFSALTEAEIDALYAYLATPRSEG